MGIKICRGIAAVLVLVLIFVIFTASDASVAAAQKCTVVNCSYRVNVCSGPGTGYSITGKAPKGAVYDVTGKSGS